MSALPGDRETTACTNCGRPYFVTLGHLCPRTGRLLLPDAYIAQEWDALTAALQAPGRHERPESESTR